MEVIHNKRGEIIGSIEKSEHAGWWATWEYKDGSIGESFRQTKREATAYVKSVYREGSSSAISIY